jgi:excisionase family DNA binding protein
MDSITVAAPLSEIRLLGLAAAASYLDVTPRTIQRLIGRGVLEPVRLPGVRRILVDHQDLDQLIETGKAGAER